KIFFDTVLCLQNGLSAMKMTFDTIKKIMSLVSFGGKDFLAAIVKNFGMFVYNGFKNKLPKDYWEKLI
ncbi:hypothetical protein FSEG_02198, partial [Fusobacterium necrophorum D12]